MSVNPLKYSPLLEVRRKTRLPGLPPIIPQLCAAFGVINDRRQRFSHEQPQAEAGYENPCRVPARFSTSLFWNRSGITPSKWTQIKELSQGRRCQVSSAAALALTEQEGPVPIVSQEPLPAPASESGGTEWFGLEGAQSIAWSQPPPGHSTEVVSEACSPRSALRTDIIKGRTGPGSPGLAALLRLCSSKGRGLCFSQLGGE